MKKYKLLKDLPTFKAGEIFEIRTEDPVDGSCLYHAESGIMAYHCNTLAKFPEILAEGSEWFEEIKEGEELWEPEENEGYYFTDASGCVRPDSYSHYNSIDKARFSIGNCFKAREEAEKAVEWLKALKVLRDDTKGFKPDWGDDQQSKYNAYYDHMLKRLLVNCSAIAHGRTFYFASQRDIEASIEAHEKEWKIFLGVEE